MHPSNDRTPFGGARDPHVPMGAPRPPEQQSTPVEPGRPHLDAVHVALRSRGTSAGVELVVGDRRLRGNAGPVRPTSVLDAVSQATARALETELAQSLEVDVVDVVEVGSDRIAMATVVASDGGSTRQRLTGSALVAGDVEDAMARAVLDATNRLWRVGADQR